MRVVLVSPATVDTASDAFLGEPVGLLYVAAAAAEAGHRVTVLDQLDPRYRERDAIAAEAARLAPDVLGVSVTTAAFPVGLAIAEAVRARHDCRVVFGGIHVTHAAEGVLAHDAVDVGVVGEGEQAFVELLAAFEAGDDLDGVAGLAFRDAAGAVVRTDVRERRDDLDDLPRPYRRGLPRAHYRIHGLLDVAPAGSGFSIVSTSRGCPHSCTFCAQLHPGRPRWTARSPGSVLDEVAELHAAGARFVFFADPNFTHRAERALAVAEGLIERRLDLRWGCEVRAGDVTPELARRLAASGCVFAGVGIESGADDTLARVRKRASLEQIRRGLQTLIDADIQVHGNVIIGFPWEDRAGIEAGFEVLRTLPMDIFGINYAVPFPGTELYRQALDEALIVDHDLSRWTTRRPVIRTRHLGVDELRELYQRMTRGFYLRPGYVGLVAQRLRRRPKRLLAYARAGLTGMAMGRFGAGFRRGRD